MKQEKIVNINGIQYSASTGMPINKSRIAKNQRPSTTEKIKNVQSATQRSQRLYNRAAEKAMQGIGSPIRKIGRSMDIARSKSISHFSISRPATSTKNKPASESLIKVKQKNIDIGPTRHHLTKKIQPKANTLVTQKPSKVTKEEIIAEALNKATEKPKQKNKRFFRFINIFTISFALIIAIIYITYISIPIISIKIASTQAGINAKYPEYNPDGYSLSGPVSYSDGEVVIKFHANTGNTEYSIRQAKSSWDSTAVREQINKDLNGEFITTEEKGLTIYTYGGNATWVNGGILYNISGNAPLKSDQIRRIATSL